MGQIIGSAAKPKRCNISQLSQLGTPAAGEHILVSSDNSMNAAGQGYFDAYVVGDGSTAAASLELHKYKAEELDEQINGSTVSYVASYSVSANANINKGYSVNIPAGSYQFASNYADLWAEGTSMQVYFKSGGGSGTTVLQKTIARCISEGVVLSSQCDYVQVYTSAKTNSGGTLNITLSAGDASNSIVAKIAALQSKTSELEASVDGIEQDVDSIVDGVKQDVDALEENIYGGEVVVFEKDVANNTIYDANIPAGCYKFELNLDTYTLYIKNADKSADLLTLTKNRAKTFTIDAPCGGVMVYGGSGHLKITKFYDVVGIDDLADESVSYLFGKDVDVEVVQGIYTNGIADNTSIHYLRTSRIIGSDELPIIVEIPESLNIIIDAYNLYNAGAFVKQVSIRSTRTTYLEITSDLFEGNDGITFTFCWKGGPTNISPFDAIGLTFKHNVGSSEVINEIPSGREAYYGNIFTPKITDFRHRMNRELIAAYSYNEYPHTTLNQSMAVYDGKAFCFNDTNLEDICVIIDTTDGSILGKIDGTLTEIGSSHLNNACFTDKFYTLDDKYPLLLLSRGDYPDGNNDRRDIHVVRVLEDAGTFSLQHIKKIHTVSDLCWNNPSFAYDACRGMIWGYLLTQDWRWGYRLSFDTTSLFFKAPAGTEYIGIEVEQQAATSATIDFRISDNNNAKNIAVTAGQALTTQMSVLPYIERAIGYSWLYVSQSAAAYTDYFHVFVCDASGNKIEEIKFQCAISGFKCPSLIDGVDTTITSSEFTDPVYIDPGIFQGACCVNGKIVIAISLMGTINWQPFDTLEQGQYCIVVDPVSGYIESVIPTSDQENEGVAIWDGVLWVSDHIGSARDDRKSFRLWKFTFD